jgi:hypothetical protein
MQCLGGTRIWDLAMVHGDVCQGLNDNVTGGHNVEQNMRIQELEAEAQFLRQQLSHYTVCNIPNHKMDICVTHVLEERSYRGAQCRVHQKQTLNF